jgi:ABC-type nitrate/sulfonate/bicarbonate transport system permease component
VSAALLPVGPVAETVSHRSVAAAVLRRLGSSVLVVVVALVLLGLAWTALLQAFDVSTFVGKTPADVYRYLLSDAPPRGVRPASISAEAARADLRAAWLVTLADAGIGFVTGMVVATLVAMAFVLVKPIEFAFMPIAMLLRSVPLVALAPVLLLVFGQGKVGVATIAAIVVLFPALVNIVLGLRSASPMALDLIRVNGGSDLRAMLLVRLPSALPSLFASVRISVPGAIVGAMLAEWLSGFTGLRDRRDGVPDDRGDDRDDDDRPDAAEVAAALAAWGPDAGKR